MVPEVAHTDRAMEALFSEYNKMYCKEEPENRSQKLPLQTCAI
jgi:hypothetical protein